MKKPKLFLLVRVLMFLTFFFSLQTYAAASSSQPVENPASVTQNISISGTVYDNTGGTLPSVNIQVKGTTIGTLSGTDGTYSITVADRNVVLIFSYIGYITQEITVGTQRVIDVTMNEDTQLLEEVVVVGYGTMKRSDISSAISTVSPKDFNKQQTFRATDALQGRVAGVSVTNTGGDPFSPVKIRIRGTNSINRGNDPLYVTNGVVGGGMPNVEDIESIEVLKDASATALYGSRGANGVILVTTKKGVAGKTTITYDGYGACQTPGKLYDKLDAATFCEAYNYTFGNPVFSESAIAEWRAKGGTDWQKEVLQNSWLQRHRVNASGGTEKVRFYTTVDYKKTEAMIRDRTSEGLGFSNRLDVELFKNVKLEWTAGISRGKSRNDGDNLRGGAGSLLFGAIINAPVARLVNEDGSYVPLPDYGPNENNFMSQLYENDQWSQSIGGSSNMALIWENIVPGLTATYRMNASYSASRSHTYESEKRRLGNAPTTNGGDSESISYFQNLILNYNKSFGNHSIGLTGVVEAYQYEGESAYYDGREFETDVLGFWGMGMGNVRTSAVGYGNESLLSYIGRLNYSYANKYVITATLRRDGSSKYTTENKWSTFPSASLAWRISEEDFLKNTGIFNDLKLRASYGITGSQAVDQYQTISQLRGGEVWFESLTSYPNYIPSVINTLLKWESTTQFDAGLDFGLLNNRISGSLDFYDKKTSDLLMQEPLPGYLGGQSVWRNKGEVSNRGVELSLRYLAVSTKDLVWELNGNIAKNVNEVVSVGQDSPIYINGAVGNGDGLDMAQINVLMSGYKLGSIFGYKTDGLWKENEAAEAAKHGAAPGDIKYKDIGGATDADGRPYQWYEDGFAGDGKIDSNDRTIIGCGTPDFVWGFNTSLIYKNWDVNLMLQGVQGAQMINVVYAAASSARQGRSSSITLAEAWEKSYRPGVSNPIFPNPQSDNTLNKQINTDFWVQDASFTRLKNFSIGYTFDRSMLKYASIRLYASAQNLLTLTKYKGLDPESTSSTSSDNRDRGTGVDNGANPTPRYFTFGVQLIF